MTSIKTSRHIFLAATFSVLGFVGCKKSPAEPAPDLAQSVRGETVRFTNTTTAISAGYVFEDHCVAHPQLGGMGYHWINESLIDPQFEPLKPEILLYESNGSGSFTLTGVEYVVIAPPGTDLEGPARPHFGSHPFDIGGVPPLADAGVAHWSLHVWLHKDNPAGLFVPFNPNVACSGAAVVEHTH